MCASRALVWSLLLILFPILLHAMPVPDDLFLLMEIPDGVIDAEISNNGDVYVLQRGSPHLLVYGSDGSETGFDLPEITVPGGMCLDQRWGWYVTGEINDIVCRYDSRGQLMESWESGGQAGDICILGLSVFYVSRSESSVLSLSDPDMLVADLEGSGEGQLTAFGARAVYSCEDESMVLQPYSLPEQLPAGGIWAACGEEMFVLMDGCIFSRLGDEVLCIRESGDYSRLSFSPDGERYLLWKPGGRRILVLL